MKSWSPQERLFVSMRISTEPFFLKYKQREQVLDFIELNLKDFLMSALNYHS
jgi:hypothetical protein